MKSIEKLENFICENNIIIDKCEHLDRFNKAALYCSIENNKIILLHPDFNSRIISEQAEILAEECGHHATSTGDTFKTSNEYLYKINTNKSERKAVLWGANYLVDINDLKKYISISDSVEELTDLLGVSLKLLYEYLYNLKNKMQYLELENNKRLNLYKLPNLVIEERG